MLIGRLSHNDDEVRCQASFSLWQLSISDPELIEQIRHHQNDSNIWVRLFVGEIICKETGDPTILIQTAIDFIATKKQRWICLGCDILGLIGDSAFSSEYQIRTLLNHQDPQVQIVASKTLNKILRL